MAIRSHAASGFLIRMIKKDGAFYVMNIHPSIFIHFHPSIQVWGELESVPAATGQEYTLDSADWNICYCYIHVIPERGW